MDCRFTRRVCVHQAWDALDYGQGAGDCFAVGLIDPCGFGDHTYLAQAVWAKTKDVQGMAAEKTYIGRMTA